MNNELKAYLDACEQLTIAFAKKYFGRHYEYNPRSWISQDIGGIICINDFYLDIKLIAEIVKLKLTRKEFFDWYDYSVDINPDEVDEPNKISLRDYIKIKREMRKKQKLISGV